MEGQVWALGAESKIILSEMWGRNVIVKSRVPKPYLHSGIDSTLRRQRTARECRMLTYARKLGIRTPAVYAVDRSEHLIVMDFIEGRQLKELVPAVTDDRLYTLCVEFGTILGRLHKGTVVHGDPTTSNVIVDEQGNLWMVDFGLAEWNATIEMMAVDLHLVKRALETTHWDRQDTMFEAVRQGYFQIMAQDALDVFQRMTEIRERGRYH